MNTPDLVQRLAADLNPPAGPHRLGFRLAAMTALASLITLVAILLLFSRSPHLVHGPTPTILFTAAAGIILAAGAFWAVLDLSHPECRGRTLWLLLPATILLLGLGLEIAHVPGQSWPDRVLGNNPLACFLSVYALSLPILFTALVALRDGASTHPRLSGAMSGLLAGGITAALYTIHCPENSLFFIAAWHVLAIFTVSLCGALIAGRYLKW